MKLLFLLTLIFFPLYSDEQRYLITEAAGQAFLLDSFTGKCWKFEENKNNWDRSTFDFNKGKTHTIWRDSPDEKLEIVPTSRNLN